MKKNKPLISGLTHCTLGKFKFHGYMVRRSKNNHKFRKYVSASSRVVAGTENQRDKIALDRAVKTLDELTTIIKNPSSWRLYGGKRLLTKKSALDIKNMGFTIDLPANEAGQEPGVPA
jgi:hypothetical protein